MEKTARSSAAFRPVPFNQVTVAGEFWGPRLETNRAATLPIEYEQCRVTGRLDAFKLNWKPGQKPIPHIFWDSDVAKWIEAASYSLGTHPDMALARQLDEVVTSVVAAQQPDGYLNTHFTVVKPDKRWANERDEHELYCAGHLIEAAVAHYQATGQRSLLEALIRYADYIATVFGTGPGQKRGYPGHEELELALVKLYRLTGERRHLALSQYFVDERGRQPHYYDLEAQARGEDPRAFWAKTYAYMQAHLPVREQERVVGHAVRAMYLYSAMADLAAETGDQDLLRACERLWDHLVGRCLYVTGGIGPSSANEGFTGDYDLPNESAYAETCAAVGLAFWAQRLLQLDCDSRYADVLERVLYNGALSGVSLDGTRFFYENPLSSRGGHHRQAWFDCSCCPPNIARLLASLGGYIYSAAENEIAVHLYVAGDAHLSVAGQPLTLRQATRYPWDGEIAIELKLEQAATFALRLRVPGWCRDARLAVNGVPVKLEEIMERGYARLEREWHSGDRVTLDLPMPVQRVYAHPDVRQDAGAVALMRGPLVYCFEQADHAQPVHCLRLPAGAELEPHFDAVLLGGVVVITGQGQAAAEPSSAELYATQRPPLHTVPVKAIPYYAWDNREAGEMQVWLPESP
ncbi:MAG: beta-L-arabinofuranosidase domain-containing protein [Anaerolineales bacterium]